MPRRLILNLLAVAAMCPLGAVDAPATTTAPAASLLTPAERTAVDALAEALVAAGVPDTRGSTVVLGKVVVSEPAPVGAQGRSQRGSANSREELKEGRRIRTFDGAHLLLTDGSWLLNLAEPIAIRADRSIEPDAAARRLLPTALLGELAGRPNQGRGGDTRWISVFRPDERTKLDAIIAQSLPLRSLDGAWAMGVNLLRLHRAGVPGADGVLLMSGLGQVWPGAIEWGDAAMPIQLLDGDNTWNRWRRLVRGGVEMDRERWMREHDGAFAIPDPVPALRRQISRWFRNMLVEPDEMVAYGFDAPRAAAQALAFLPEERRAISKADLDLLTARLALPQKAPADADLATCLQSWAPGRLSDEKEPEISEEMIARMPAEAQEHMRQQLQERRAWKPADSDIPALLALLTDPRPSRWLDSQNPRTVGDCALRALARLVRFDPRLLVGRDPAAPWNDAERTATAEGLRAWWTALGGKPLADGLTETVDRLPVAAASRLVASRPAENRPALLDRIAASWQGKAPPAVEPEDLAHLLAAAGDHAGIAAQVATWPVAGALRPLLAVWQDGLGKPAELDKLLEELATAGNADDQAASALATALRHAMRKPSPSRLQRCLALIAGPPDDRRSWVVLRAINNMGGYYLPEWQAVDVLTNQGRRPVTPGGDAIEPSVVLPLIGLCVMLADSRPIPPGSAKLEMRGRWGSLQIAGSMFGISPGEEAQQDAPAKQLPQDLRIRDIAASQTGNLLWQVGLNDVRNARVDLFAPIGQRDATINIIYEAMSERARDAAKANGLPDVLAAPKPADGDKALF